MATDEERAPLLPRAAPRASATASATGHTESHTSNSRSALLSAWSGSSEGLAESVSSTSGYSSIARIESPADGQQQNDDDRGFRLREHARLRKVVLVVVGITTVLMAAGLMVGLLAPSSLPLPTPPATFVILPVP